MRLNTSVDADMLVGEAFDEVVVATGVRPRWLNIPGANHPKVISYVDAILGTKPVGLRVVIVGAGGIGFDTALLLAHAGAPTSLDRQRFLKEWGVDQNYRQPGGLLAADTQPQRAHRHITMLQRKASKMGASLGKTTGWIHRATLKKCGVEMINGVTYEKIDDQGLHIAKNDIRRTIIADNIVVCAGQEPLRTLADDLENRSMHVHVIGGADKAAELDAQRAIDQGTRLAIEV